MMQTIDFTQRRKRKTMDDVPQDELLRMAVKLYLVGALAWDYAETVLDIAIQMKIPETKKLVRAVRETKRDYDRMRSLDLDSEQLQRERELAELFEEINKDNFRKLCLGLSNEIHRSTNLAPDYVMLVEAVQIAMTVLDAMNLFASHCDGFIKQYYPSVPHSILPDHFRKLSVLLPQFAGDCYNSYSHTRQLTAKILLNEINAIELYDENGKI